MEGKKLHREKIMQGTTSDQIRQGRPTTRWQDNIMKWTGLTSDHLLKSSKDRSQRRKIMNIFIHHNGSNKIKNTN